MIAKISQLKTQTTNADVKALCENTINALSSTIYNHVTTEAKSELEHAALTNLFEGLSKYPKDKFITEWLNNQKRIYSVKNLGVKRAVTKLLEKEGKFDATLRSILEDFREKLDDIPEILLYENFISAMSGFSYLPAVNTELSAVSQRVNQYKNDVDITKIIEVMKDTRSNYLIPLIEDVVENYLNNKNEQTKSSLKETLVKFSYDPFVKDIINLLVLDSTNLQLEYANSDCEIEEKLFSPIVYLGENEALFNVRGTYYIRKGNNINKIKSTELSKLDENFKSFCDILNQSNIEVSKNKIDVFEGKDHAIITESSVLINDKKFDKKQINEAYEISKMSGNTHFYDVVNILSENFNEIAELDFVKRVYLKENEGYSADIFKLRDNIFITTHDVINNKSTFYRNINPIQAEKIMMEHMRFDVSKTFEDILPNKEKIILEIEKTKQEYTDYIKLLENKIETFKQQITETSKEVIDNVLDALNEELDEITNDYKNYLNQVESFTSVAENLNITVQDDSSGKSYTVVVPTGAMASKGEQGGGSSADSTEFGTEVGSTNVPTAGGSASAITFDDDQSELLSDEPSSDMDDVDLNADELEAQADMVDAETELESPENPESTENPETAEEPESSEKPEDSLGLGDEGEGSETLDLELGDDKESDNKEDSEEKPEKSEETEKKESVEPPQPELKRTNFNKDKNPNDISDVVKKKVYLKRPKAKK